MFQQKISFKNSLGLTLAALLEGERRDVPVVVMCHGYGSSKNSTSTTGLSSELVKKGITTFRFDFTGCGQSEGKLADLVPSQGLDDLKSAISHMGFGDFALYGSSFGGHVSIWYASKDPVLALALKAPVSDYADVVSEEISDRRKKFIEDTRDLDLYEKAKNIKSPVLILHGDADDVVPIGQSKKLIKHIGGEAKLEVLRGTSHDIRDENLELMQDAMAAFFAKNLLP
ncbi:MAG: alpha/beta fold hydrolase [Candidatus Woykebacteria bacterium]